MNWDAELAAKILESYDDCHFMNPTIKKSHRFHFGQEPKWKYIAIARERKDGVTVFVNTRSRTDNLFIDGMIPGVEITKKYPKGYEGKKGSPGISGSVARLPSLNPKYNDVIRLKVDGSSAFKNLVDWYAGKHDIYKQENPAQNITETENTSLNAPSINDIGELFSIDDDVSYKNTDIDLHYELDKESNLIDVEFANIPGEDVDAVVKRRIGQGVFRSLLESIYGVSCCLSGLTNSRLLIASHIVPWSKSLPEQKTDPENGLLLSVTWDALFDKGFISFDDRGYLLCSNKLDDDTVRYLGISRDIKLPEYLMTSGRKNNLAQHRERHGFQE